MAKIVVLDDVFLHGEQIEARLMLDGHDVRVVSTAADAIDLAYLFQPDLLISDWNLESDDYTGIEVAEAFRAANADIKTIVMSVASFENEYPLIAARSHGKDLGLIAFLPKPVSIDQLAETVDNVTRTSLRSERSSQFVKLL